MEYSKPPSQMHGSFRLSWTAYGVPLLVFVLLAAVAAGLFYVNGWAGSVCLIVAIGVLSVQVLSIRSVMLYTDDYGVWVYQGLLPWSKGVTGVKWRDLEEAVFMTSFFSWALNAYTVRVGHRFTKTSEIVLQHVNKGREAVEHINDLHRQVLAGRTGHYDETGDDQAVGSPGRP